MRKPKFELPDECGPLADYLYLKLKQGDADHVLEYELSDFQASVEFLESLPEGTTVRDIDFLTNISWTADTAKEIKQALQRDKGMSAFRGKKPAKK